MTFSEQFKIVPLTVSANVGAGGVDTKSINFGKIHKGCFLLNFGAITADDVLSVYVGAATATKTTAVAYKYRHAAADTTVALSDTYGALTDVPSTGLTLSATTFDNKLLIVEIGSQAIADATPWVTLEIAGSASVQNISIIFIGEPRFASNGGLPTVI